MNKSFLGKTLQSMIQCKHKCVLVCSTKRRLDKQYHSDDGYTSDPGILREVNFTCMLTYVHAYIHTHIHTYMPTHKHTYIHTHITHGLTKLLWYYFICCLNMNPQMTDILTTRWSVSPITVSQVTGLHV